MKNTLSVRILSWAHVCLWAYVQFGMSPSVIWFSRLQEHSIETQWHTYNHLYIYTYTCRCQVTSCRIWTQNQQKLYIASDDCDIRLGQVNTARARSRGGDPSCDLQRLKNISSRSWIFRGKQPSTTQMGQPMSDKPCPYQRSHIYIHNFVFKWCWGHSVDSYHFHLSKDDPKMLSSPSFCTKRKHETAVHQNFLFAYETKGVRRYATWHAP